MTYSSELLFCWFSAHFGIPKNGKIGISRNGKSVSRVISMAMHHRNGRNNGTVSTVQGLPLSSKARQRKQRKQSTLNILLLNTWYAGYDDDLYFPCFDQVVRDAKIRWFSTRNPTNMRVLFFQPGGRRPIGRSSVCRCNFPYYSQVKIMLLRGKRMKVS